jgi:hypothetical protein
VRLGHSGIAACEADAGKMKTPLVIVLVEHDDPVISLADYDGGDRVALRGALCGGCPTARRSSSSQLLRPW